MTVATDDLRTEARQALAKVRREIEEASSRRTALLMHYLNKGVPMTDIADGLSTRDRTHLYEVARKNGWKGAVANQPVELNGHQVHPSVRRVYDVLVERAGPDARVEIRISDLAGLAGFSYSSIWRILARLVELGVIEREPGDRDGGQFGPSRFRML